MALVRLPPREPEAPLRVGVLASGRGSNLRALLEARAAGRLPWAEIVTVVSNNPGALALDAAREQRIDATAIDHRPFGPDRAAHEGALLRHFGLHRVDFLVLAGYMRLLTPRLVGAFAGRMINIHPALLPSFPGVHAQRQAVDYGVRTTGCTVHFVTEEMDAGPIIVQRHMGVAPWESEARVAARLLAEEHRALPHALDLVSRRRTAIVGRRVLQLCGPSSFPELEQPGDSCLPLLMATGNAHKVTEVRAILKDLPVYLQGTQGLEAQGEPVEDAPDYEGNARIKAAFWRERVGGWCLADDSGLEVDALGGRPGIHSSRYAPTADERNRKLLAELDGVPDEKRTARFICLMVLQGPDGQEHVARGTCEGRIAREPRGTHGFGYDPVFLPDEVPGRHLAEVDEETKNRISHRGRALAALRPALEDIHRKACK